MSRRIAIKICIASNFLKNRFNLFPNVIIPGCSYKFTTGCSSRLLSSKTPTKLQNRDQNNYSIQISKTGKFSFSSLIMDSNANGNPVQMSKFSKEEVLAFLDNISAVMFDCDGVLWLGNDPLKNAQALVIKLRSMGKKIFFMTNNSTMTRQEFLVKFNKLGFDATEDEIVSTAYLTALHLNGLGFNGKCYVVGSPGITQELESVGIPCLPIGPDVVPPSSERWSAKDFEQVELDPEVRAVVVGFDHHFSYVKVLKAASYLKDPECLFIATNTDEQFPDRARRVLVFPGTGTFVNAVKTAAGRQPVVMGKPEPFPFELVSKKYDLKPEQVLMVGDRGNTDILFGRKCGLRTLLVLSGVTSIEDMHRWESSEEPEEKMCIPDYYLEDVNEFYQFLI